MNELTVCLSPELIHQFSLREKIVVVVDVFRATSCMVTGLAHGVTTIYPVQDIDQCKALGKAGAVMAGERGGLKIEGFELGNSPFDYMQESLKNRSVAVTTTNGTKALIASKGAERILVGAFLNISALAALLSASGKDIVVHCAGWQGTVNVEDTLFAGALADRLTSSHAISDDPALLAWQLYHHNRNDILTLAKNSSHAKRLAGFGVEKDLEFCMTPDQFREIPELFGDRLSLAQQD